MEATGQTPMLIWLGVLIAPPLLFGIWMRIKLMFTEQGEEFLVDREVAKTKGEYDTPYYLREEHGEARADGHELRKRIVKMFNATSLTAQVTKAHVQLAVDQGNAF